MLAHTLLAAIADRGRHGTFGAHITITLVAAQASIALRVDGAVSQFFFSSTRCLELQITHQWFLIGL
jgi:hypothetical protein